MMKESIIRSRCSKACEKEEGRKKERSLMDDQPELSLTLVSSTESANSSSSESDVNTRRKRKQTWDEPAPISQSSTVDLQLRDPLPLDWEQCLDLHSGRMYYMNRKTLKKSWMRPKEQKLDLELNISALPTPEDTKNPNSTITTTVAAAAELDEPKRSSAAGNNNNMVAVVCIKCHLLVMLCRSSPCCPNCKHINSLLPPAQPTTPSPSSNAAVEPLKTLSLLH
ncbi:hypothetical protein Cni_G20047 [Canna indica]|uniref:WW domain-containing protein n=1 Tax=Canna indica TaxID=4628 RepID=A0AAQ3KNC9_9LILI|nr:hypothetical protein Cni_G20047 [Canna indica]